MDYNYIRLENQIKALMNQSHVPSSSVSKIAESLKNGSLELYVDTIQKCFVFKYAGINNPISVDPLKKEIFNVELLNGVSVANLVGGITKGYGINIEETSKGVYKISVIEDMFATKTELNTVDEKFDDYTTTADLEANYALKSEVSTVDGKFDDYTTTADLEANYAKLKNLDEYVKKTDIAPSESQFEIVNGYPEYYVKHTDISTYSPDDMSPIYNIMKITISNEQLRNQIEASTKS